MIDPTILQPAVPVLQAATGLYNCIRLVDYLRSLKGSDVISTCFSADGARIDGSRKIKIKTHRSDPPAIWWYEVKPLKDYVFLRFPLGSGVYEEVAWVKGDSNPRSDYWRWRAQPPTAVRVGDHPPNVTVDFLVVGFKLKALIDRLQSDSG